MGELIQVICNMADKEGCVGFSCEHYTPHISNNRPGVICTEESRCPEIGGSMTKCIDIEYEQEDKRVLEELNKNDETQHAILKLPKEQYITTGLNNCNCNNFQGKDFNEMYCNNCGQKYSFIINIKPVWMPIKIEIKNKGEFKNNETNN